MSRSWFLKYFGIQLLGILYFTDALLDVHILCFVYLCLFPKDFCGLSKIIWCLEPVTVIFKQTRLLSVIRSYNQELKMLIFVLSFSFPERKRYKRVGICVIIQDIICYISCTPFYMGQEISYSFGGTTGENRFSIYSPCLPHPHTKITHTHTHMLLRLV